MRIRVILIMLLSLGWARGGAAEVLFSDTFTGPDLSKPSPESWLMIDAPDKGYWYLQGGQLASGNGDDLESATGYSLAVIRSPGSERWSDYTIQCDAWMSQRNGRICLVGRWQDKNNCYLGYVEANEGSRGAGILKLTDGRLVSLAGQVASRSSRIPAIEAGESPVDSHTYAMALRGDTISLTLDGKALVTASDKNQPFLTGGAGLGESKNFVYFDNVKVAGLDAMAAAGGPSMPAPTARTSAGATSPFPAATSGELYHIVFASGLSENDANNFKQKLESWGLAPISMARKADGIELQAGSYLSEAEARRAMDDLATQGFIAKGVVSEAGKASSLASGGGATVKKIYRVQTHSVGSLLGAQQVKTSLESDGYILPIEIVQEDGMHNVYVGTFADQAEAQKLTQVLTDDGYFNTKVKEVNAPPSPLQVSTAPTVATTAQQPSVPRNIRDTEEWKNLTPEQQKKLEEVVGEQRAVAEGNVLVQQFVEFRKKLDTLDQSQKEIVRSIREQDEAERDRKIQVARLYDQVEKLKDQQKFDEALAKLDEIQQIDPSDPRIDFKQQVLVRLKENRPEGFEALEASRKAQTQAAMENARNLEQQGDLEGAKLQWLNVKNIDSNNKIAVDRANTEIGRINGELDRKAEQISSKARRQMWFMAGAIFLGVLALLGLVGAFLMINLRNTRKRNEEIMKQVQELTLKPLMELEQTRKLLESGRGQALPPASGSPVGGAPMISGQDLEPPPVDDFGGGMPITTPMTSAPPPPPPPSPPDPARPKRARESAGEEAPVLMFSDVEETPVARASSKPPMPAVPPPVFEMPDLESEKPEAQSAPQVDEVMSFDFGLGEEKQPQISSMEPSIDDLLMGGSGKKGLEPKSPGVGGALAGMDIGIPGSIDLSDLGGEDTVNTNPPIAREEETQKLRPGAGQDQTRPSMVPSIDDLMSQAMDMGLAHEPSAHDHGTSDEPHRPAIAGPSMRAAAAFREEEKSLASADGRIYEQTFDDEAVGAMPRNWKGEYDYASLVVTNTNPAPGSSKCMKFDKKSGAGSAFYSCQFPAAKGSVVIEFSLRCDEKNKYLLGFYIEKDEDFRQSIHTIVHRSDSKAKPTLRIQGETSAYDLGQWRRIRYEVNLKEGVVNGYVDNQLVADRVKMASCPNVLNTLSIRDNLATTGVLLLDDIRITSA